MTSPTPDDSRPPIAAAIITQDGRVLMVRRRVSEGSLSWQFPAGEVEEGESGADAAVREAHEETGLVVSATATLGERVHPKTNRTMIYVACEVIEGTASVVDDEELDDFAWVSHEELATYVPYGLFEPVQQHLDSALRRS